MIANTIQDKLSEIFAAYPGKCAIQYGDNKISYSQLDKKSSILAAYLVCSGVPKGSLISILLDNKAELIFTIIGILKAGCVFVPLDPSYPDKRLRDMVESTQTVLVFSDSHHAARLENIVLEGNKKAAMISLEEVFAAENDLLPFNVLRYLPEDMVYIYFTSGTSGKPKAIAGQNKGLLHFLNWEIETFGITGEFRISQFTPQCHDPFLRDIFVPLCTGGTICIPPSKEIILETNSMINWIEKSAVKLIHCTPGLFRVFNSPVLTGEHFQQLKYILLAGEKIIPGELTKWYELMGERIQLVNIYGPTETTLAKFFYLINENDIKRKNKTISIGKPISGAKAIILTKDMEICSQGEIGEIFIRTPYRSLGYLNAPMLTQAKFMANPFNHDPNDLIYGTGDLGRVLPDGNIEFMGRTDHQVKIRGFRVELDEIENEILDYPGITGCVVDYRDDDSAAAAELFLCKKCGLPSSYPGTTYRDDGMCNICQFYENNKQKTNSYFKTIEDLRRTFDPASPHKKDEYDCLLLYSGGKDSTYVLYQLKDMGLNVLAYTFDNAFISPKALENIKAIVKELQVDHIIETSEEMSEIFREGLKTENSVCNGCFKVLRRKSTKLAYEKGIKYIVTGFSRGQIYDLRLYDIYKLDIFEEKAVEEKIREERLLYHSQRDYVTELLGESGIDKNIVMKVGLIDFFRYSAITKEEILQYLKKKSSYWNNPGDTGFCSSNCLINDVGIHMQRKNYRYDNYTFPNSWEVRTGHMSLAEANREFASEIDVIKVERILKQLNFDRDDHNDEQVNASAGGFLAAYYVSGKDIESNKLKEHLREKLPGYMIPPYFVRLDKIPLTPNKKVDYNALPDPRKHLDKEYREPEDEIERKLAQIWRDILGVEQVSVEENFLQMGGHSLNLMNLISRVYKEFDVEIPLGDVFYDASLRGIAGYIRDTRKESYLSVAPAEKKEYYLLSSAQKRLYVLQQMIPESTVYNMPLVISLGEEADREKLETTFIRLTERHESFRASFLMVNGEPVQRIHGLAGFKIERPEGKEVKSLISNFVRAFDLSRTPLLRAGLLETGDGTCLLVVDMHHIVTDGVSLNILVQDFTHLYPGGDLPPLRIQYKDFAEWQTLQSQRESMTQQESFWLKTFKGEIPLLNLPIDYPRPVVQSFAGDTMNFQLSTDDTAALKALAMESDVTLYMVLLAIFNILLSKLTGQEDIIIGTVVAARRHADLEKIIGMFVNTLVLRNFPNAEKPIKEFLREVKDNTLETFENQEYPFEELVEKVDVERDTGRNPLFDVMFSFQNIFEEDEIPEAGIAAKDSPFTMQDRYQYENPTAKFDLTFAAGESEGRLLVGFQYCASLFKKATIERFKSYFEKTISIVIENSAIKISDIEILSEEERRKLLHDFNNTGEKYPREKTLHQLFRDQVKKTPHHIALVSKEHRERGMESMAISVTYKELNHISRRLAGVLKGKGVKPDTITGLMVEWSLEMIIGILGVIKAGGAYVPLNPKTPASRNGYLLKECSAEILLTARSLFEEGEKLGSWEGENIFLEDRENVESFHAPCSMSRAGPGHLAYVIFTSGSTGSPKGVPIAHANLSPLLHWGYRQLRLGPPDRVIQNLSYYFDWSVMEIFITITTGAGLIITSREVLLNPQLCAAFIDKQNITALHVTPSQYQYLVQIGRPLETLQYLFIGGEKLTLDLARRSFQLVKEGCRVFNVYGPTECAINTSLFELDAGTLDVYRHLTSVPIGPPAANADYLVLDKYLKLCPTMITGELYIAGDCLAPGYINDPEKARGAFVPNVYEKEGITGSRLYKTGDMARWLPDGTVEYLGRIDHQVKIRGYRIELGEIENQLLKHQDVRDAVVLVNEDAAHDKYICAYLVAGQTLSTMELKQYLAQQLPDYMIPSYFVQIEKIPLNPNGKLDRKALPVPGPKAEGEYKAPGNDVETKLVEIWAEVLGIKKDIIGIDANFFQLGGHSLKAAVVLSKVHKELEVKIPLVEIFTNPTVRELAECIKGLTEEQYKAIEPVEKKDYYAVSSGQRRLYVLQQMIPESTAYNMPLLISLGEEADAKKLETTFIRLIERHESFRTSFLLVNEEPVQRIHEEPNHKFQVTNYRSLSHNRLEIPNIINEFVKPFDLTQMPLLRVGYINTNEGKVILLLDMHHIVMDGLSLEILKKEFLAIYKGKMLPPLRIQYKDYAHWQNSVEQQELMKKQEQYWLKNFSGPLPQLKLLTDYPRPPAQTFAAHEVTLWLTEEETQVIRNIAEEAGATVYISILALLNVLFSKLSGQEDIVIGIPNGGRKHNDLQYVIGMFVNMLPTRNYPCGDKSFKKFMLEVKARTLEAFDNQDYQFEDLVANVVLERQGNRNPIFDIVFNMINIGDATPLAQLEEITPDAAINEHFAAITAFDIIITTMDYKSSLLFYFKYNATLFKQETINRHIQYFKAIISSLQKDRNIKLADLCIAAGPGLLLAEPSPVDGGNFDF